MTNSSSKTKAVAESTSTKVSAPAEDHKCDNHPQRKAVKYTQNGAVEQYLCAECTPEWYKSENTSE